MSTSTFRRISRPAARSTSTATKSAATASACGWPARTSTSPTSTAAEPAKSAAKWSAFDESASLRYRRAARMDTAVRVRSMMSTTPITASAYHAACTWLGREPTSRAIDRSAITRLARTRIVASARAARCSALPCPYAWPVSAGRPATPTAKNVSSAATRSVPECTASEISPRLCVARPVASLSAISATAAATEMSAVRRCGLMGGRIARHTEEPAEAGSSGHAEATQRYEVAMSPTNCSDTPFVPLSCQWR